MSRLTKKLDEGFYVSNALCTDDLKNKLGKLEDLEDELGCPLEVVFKALKEGIVYFDDTPIFEGLVHLKAIQLGYCVDSWFISAPNVGIFHPKDYGKTWWLKGEINE